MFFLPFQVEGTLSVQPQANPVKGFEEYFLNLTVENNLRNPWFVGKFRGNEIQKFDSSQAQRDQRKS